MPQEIRSNEVPFVCLDCMCAGSLRITLKIELPPDSRSDEITLQNLDTTDAFPIRT